MREDGERDVAFGGECVQAVHGAEGIEGIEAWEEDEADAEFGAGLSVRARLSFE